MKSLRIGQIAAFIFFVFLLAVAWKSANFLLGAAAFGCLGFAIFDILMPPQKRFEKKIEALREAGIYPPPNRLPTDNDIRRLKHSGEKILAMQMYIQLHSVSLKEAKNAIEKMK